MHVAWIPVITLQPTYQSKFRTLYETVIAVDQMINTIGGKVVMVSDQKKAVDFYTKKLGFDLRERSLDVFVAPGTSLLRRRLFLFCECHTQKCNRSLSRRYARCGGGG